jgi:hypothetical protein
MCERAKDEPITKFWFRKYVEDPFKVLSFGALCAILWLYIDSQEKQAGYLADMKAQSAQQMQDMRDQNKILLERIESETKAMNSVANRLDLISNRLEHLEREHETLRHQDQ